MKKTMLTYKTLDRFEREYKTEQYTPEQVETIEHAAYVANMNQCNNPDWTEADIFADFIRVLEVHKIETETAEADETETSEQEETKMKNAEFIAALTAQLAAIKNRSAWDRGVQQYAEDFAAELAENLNGGYISLDDLRTGKGAEEAMLNGADNWDQYSYGGSSYIYDWDIARILCTPSELKRTRNGERNPNSRETWLDVQARALFQACNRTKKAIRRAFETVEEVY